MSLRLDGRLDPEREGELQAHLAECQTCHQQWEAMSWACSVLEGEPSISPPPDFTAKVGLRLQHRELRRGRLLRGFGVCVGSVGLWATAGAVAILVLSFLWRAQTGTHFLDKGVPMAVHSLLFLDIVGRAVWFALRALFTRPSGVILFGCSCLAVALTICWTRIVRQCQGGFISNAD